ncbi:DNRLRE domain-containing protein [Streptomyces sp. NPDC017890]|uniref:DNRLRE domain-containing protein n=1 Tax=Streptomyces sp. NPDC017890 TaxID=3365015 RepID=UPI0037AD160C
MSPYRSPISRHRARIAAGAALLLVAEAALIAGGSASAAPAAEPQPAGQAESAGPSKADLLKSDMAWAAEHARGSKAWALAEAERTGKKSVVTDETTPTSYTVANPDGTLTTELTAGPERVWKNGAWQRVDAILAEAADGSVAPKLHPHGLRLAGKGGTLPKSLRAAQDDSARDLVTLGSGDDKVTLQWKGGLPQPKLDGTRARYENAVPGADLIVEATRTGFEQFVEIGERPTGTYSYTLPIRTEGLEATENKDGSVTFTDAESGAVRATMPAPVMWDAAVDKVSGEHTNRARVDMKVIDKGVGEVDLVVTPSAEFLADPDTKFPVTVDPSTSALSNTFDTYVQQGETVDWSTDTELDFGNPGTKNSDGTPRTARSFITWNTTPIQDALIVDTNLALWNFHSGNTDCTAQKWTVWDTSAPSTSSRWTSQPTWKQEYHSSTQTAGNLDCTATQPDGWINADVDTLVQSWASAKATRGHMGLRAATDDTKAWKRVNSANNTANQPKLSVTYNYRPSDGTNRQAGAPFRSYAGVWAVNTTTPILRDTVTDPDGDKVNVTFQVYDAATNTPITTPAGEGLVVSDFVDSGKPASVTVPAGQLRDGKTYKFRTNAYDGTHYNLSWSPWTQFVVDTTAPAEPKSITSATYPENWGGGGAGIAGTFDVTTGDASPYEVQYRLNPFEDDADDYGWTSVRTVTPVGRAVAPEASYTATPAADGNHVVQTRTVDRAGNVGPIKDYGFTAGNRDYNRAQKVDIALPQPDTASPAPDHINTPIPVAALMSRAGGGSARSTSSRTFTSGQVSVTVTSLPERSEAWRRTVAADGEPGTVSTRAMSGPVIKDKSVCDPAKPDQKSVYTRDAACLIEQWKLSATDPTSGGLQKFMQTIEVMLQVQVDRTSDSGLVETYVQMKPLDKAPDDGYLPFFGADSVQLLGTKARCGKDTGGCVEEDTSFTWAGDDEPTWAGNSDTSVKSGNVTHKWNGSLQNDAGKRDIDLSKKFPVDVYTIFTSDQEVMEPGHGTWNNVEVTTQAVNVRCDKVFATHGCVIPDYVPGYKFNAGAYPAASAHAWLIQNKAKYKGLGASPLNPLKYIPGPKKGEKVPSRPANGYNKNHSREKVMCPKSRSSRTDGWVPERLFLNHPKTFLHHELIATGSPDSISCDEYPFAATYQSPGMPSSVGGLMPAGPNGGGECVQTVAVKADDGSEHLVDDTRYNPPTWDETCGRSSMSNAVNGGSMDRMTVGLNPFLSKMRMLDKDEFWVDPGNEWFTGCDLSGPEVKCTMKK